MNESAREAGRLDGWKAIAAYLGKDSARTAQRYEREFGLPVHRLSLKGGDTVYAFKAELDETGANRSAQRQEATRLA